MSVDPLWALYLSNQPYHYSLNQPVSQLDPGGDIVQAMDEQAREAIIESVEGAFESVVRGAFRDEGTLNATVLKKAAEGQDPESNIAILSRLAENDQLIEVYTKDEYLATEGHSSNTKTFQLIALNEKPFGSNVGKLKAGMTVLPVRDEKADKAAQKPLPFSCAENGAVQVYIERDMKGTGTTSGKVAAHELFAHVRRYLMWRLGKASDYWHGAPRTEAAIKKAEEDSTKPAIK